MSKKKQKFALIYTFFVFRGLEVARRVGILDSVGVSAFCSYKNRLAYLLYTLAAYVAMLR
jgi:hypothetical protein